MKRIFFAISAPCAVVAWLLIFSPLPVQVTSRTIDLGIDQSFLSGQSPATQETAFSNIQSLGAKWFRDGPTSGSPRGISNFVDEVKRAKAHNLKYLMIVSMMDEDFDTPDNLPKNARGWKEKKLSQMNLDKYSARLRRTFDALKAANKSADAVEFGNEYDAYFYDADVPNGRELSADDESKWLHGYARFLKTGALVLHEYFPSAQIITFGIAHGSNSNDWPPHHLENAAQFVAKLRNVDGFNYLDNSSYHVDGYGIHIYPSPNAMDDRVNQILHDDVAALGTSKPYWITEFGFLEPKNFPNRKGQTAAECLSHFMSLLDGAHASVPMGPAMYYSYQPWLADDTGNLTPAASALVNYTHANATGQRPIK